SEARDAIEGISIAEQHLPDLVISNVVTPTVEGYEFVRRMRERATGVRTPVILYAAADHQRDARKLALSCGAADVLLKPGEPNAILATVNAVLASIGRVSPRQDSLRFDRDHLRAVNSRLASKAELVEAGGQPLAAIIEI